MTRDSSAPGGTITVEREGDAWVARLAGEVDAAVVQTFTAGTTGDDVDPAAVDTADVTFIDSSGLALMLRWATRARARGGTAELRRPSDAVLTLLSISGTRSLFAEPEGTDPGPARST